jgi:hypothetical protein
MLPRDREVLAQELGIRAANKLGSLEHLIEVLGDVQDPSAEVKKIMAEQNELAEIAKKNQPINSPASTGEKGAISDGSQSNSRRSKKA